jgi:hypothetical protein
MSKTAGGAEKFTPAVGIKEMKNYLLPSWVLNQIWIY